MLTLFALLAQCSRTCGGGIQKRDVLCKQRMADGSFLELPETFCSASKPTSQQGCKKDDCPSEWLLSEWSEVRMLLRRREPRGKKSSHTQRMKTQKTDKYAQGKEKVLEQIITLQPQTGSTVHRLSAFQHLFPPPKKWGTSALGCTLLQQTWQKSKRDKKLIPQPTPACQLICLVQATEPLESPALFGVLSSEQTHGGLDLCDLTCACPGLPCSSLDSLCL